MEVFSVEIDEMFGDVDGFLPFPGMEQRVRQQTVRFH